MGGNIHCSYYNQALNMMQCHSWEIILSYTIDCEIVLKLCCEIIVLQLVQLMICLKTGRAALIYNQL